MRAEGRLVRRPGRPATQHRHRDSRPGIDRLDGRIGAERQDRAGIEQRAPGVTPRLGPVAPVAARGCRVLAKVDGHLDPGAAKQLYARAEYVAAAALHMFATFHPVLESVDMHVLPAPSASLDGVPDWEKLFGSADLCACEECGSVHGPAAYLVERDNASEFKGRLHQAAGTYPELNLLCTGPWPACSRTLPGAAKIM